MSILFEIDPKIKMIDVDINSYFRPSEESRWLQPSIDWWLVIIQNLIDRFWLWKA